MEIKGIKYIAPMFDNSGYAKASRGNILALHKLGIPLTVKPIFFEETGPDLGEDGKILKSLVGKDIDYNINIIHSTPEFWSANKEVNKKNLGYTIWETTKLHHSWPSYINDNVDAVMVGCEWNVDVFKESGVTKPIFNVPHCVDFNKMSDVTPFHVKGVADDTYMFYSIFQWCYDEKTRVLTKNGFKYFKDLLYEDEVATLNKYTEELEYQKPDKIVKFKRIDKMYCLNGSQFDMCVTPDHKMVVKEHVKIPNKNSSDSFWELKPFNDIVVKNKKGEKVVSSKYRAKKNCKWCGKEQTVFKVPMLDCNNYLCREGTPIDISMDIFLEFMGWYLSKGSTYKAKRGYVTTITQIKEKYRVEILNCIKRMGYTPFETKNGKDIRFHSREIYFYLKQFGKCDKKFIPTWVKNLSSRQINILLSSLFKGDGSLYKNGDWIKYTTTSKQLAEDVQECLLKIGMSGSISTSNPIFKTAGKIEGREIKGKLLQYTVSVNRKHNEPAMCYASFKEIDYDGFVYCATVPNHIMLVERNGKIIFSGNTERKNPVSLIKAYWYAFQNDENVALVLKTYRSNYSEEERNVIRSTIKRLKQVMPMPKYPPIYLILDMLSDAEIAGYHNRGSCYVSLDRGEGFGLPHFEAGALGNPIIVTGFGGVTEFAKSDNSYLVDYSLTPVSGMPWSPWYNGNQLWAEADVKQGSDLMKHVYTHQDEAKAKGLQLQNYIHTNFSYDVIGNKIKHLIELL